MKERGFSFQDAYNFLLIKGKIILQGQSYIYDLSTPKLIGGLPKEKSRLREIPVEKFLALSKEVDYFLSQGRHEDPPQFVIIMGGVGAGKTTIRKEKYKEGYVLIDSGELYQRIKGIIAKGPEEENSFMYLAGSELLKAAINERRNIIVEIIGEKAEPLESIIKKMKEVGYDVHLDLITNDIKNSWENNLNRSKDNTSAFYTQDETLSWFTYYFEILNDGAMNRER
jgi:hypothetical protein